MKLSFLDLNMEISMSIEALRWAWQISLKPGPKLVLVCLADMANSKGICFPKQSTVARRTGLGRTTVSRHIKDMEEEAIIKQTHQRYKNGRKGSSLYTLFLQGQFTKCQKSKVGSILNTDLLVDDLPSSDSEHGDTSNDPPCSKTEHHRVRNLNISKENHHIKPSIRKDTSNVSDETFAFDPSNKSENANTQDKKELQVYKSKTKSIANPNVEEIFKYWQMKMNHPGAKLDPKRVRKIQGALNMDYSAQNLKQAIDGCANTAFNMGENDAKRRYDSVDLIFRSADNIERFMDAASNKPIQDTNSILSKLKRNSEGAI